MTEPKAVLRVDFDSGGSGHGVSHYCAAVSCPRRARLALERIKSGEKRKPKLSRDAGTVFHALVEIYHKTDGKLRPVVKIDDIGYDEIVAKGTAMFNAYAAHFEPTIWGKVIAAELLLPGLCDEECECFQKLDKTDCRCGRHEREVAIFNYFDMRELTARLDLVTEVDQFTINNLRRRFNLDLPGPGVYIVDHKTHGQTPQHMELQDSASLQFEVYPLMWNACFKEQCKGIIVNHVIGHKTMRLEDEGKGKPKSFYQRFIPTVSDPEPTVSWLKTAEAMAQTDWPNRAQCVSWNDVCWYFSTGECDRK